MSTSDAVPADALDVRVLPPIERHKRLLKMFKELPIGESFVFINDHDPLPLYYEFCSVHGDVVVWDYLKRGGTDWRVKVTRSEASKGREAGGVSTLLDLRKISEAAWKYVIFHRYGMMEEGDTMEIVALQEPKPIHAAFEEKFKGQYDWVPKTATPSEYVVHVTKRAKSGDDGAALQVVKEFDVRPHAPAQRHEMVFSAFDELKPGQAFVFTNDHDPKPLYYQIEAESREPFSWEYLESGPTAWRVRVAKTA